MDNIKDFKSAIKDGTISDQDLKKLDAFLKANPQEANAALLKEMYELMLGDLEKPNPVVFKAAYNAARIIHANLTKGTKIFEDKEIHDLLNQMFGDLHILTDSPKSNAQNPTNIKLQNLKSYGKDAFEAILKDAYDKDRSLSNRLQVVGDKQITLTPEPLKFDGSIETIAASQYSDFLPKTAVNLGRKDTRTALGTDSSRNVYAYMEVPNPMDRPLLTMNPMERDLPTPPSDAVRGTPYADRTPLTNGYQGATNAASTASATPASEYAELQLGPPSATTPSPTHGKLPERPLPPLFEEEPKNQYGLRPKDADFTPMAYFPIPNATDGQSDADLPERANPEIDRNQYQPFKKATQQYAGVDPTSNQYAEMPMRPDQELRPLPNPANVSPTLTTANPTVPAVDTGRPDTTAEDGNATAERAVTTQKYHLSLTDQILTDDIKRNDSLRAQRMIAGSLLANMGLPTSEIDRILDKAFVANLDSAEFKSLEGARLLKLREIISGIYRGGAADNNSINNSIKDQASILLSKIGGKKLNNETFVGNNYSDLAGINSDALERGNKMLSDSLENPNSKEWTNAVLDSITDEINYPKIINERYNKLTENNNPKEYSFKSRMQIFGGVMGTGAAIYIIGSLFFPPLAFIGSVMLVFAAMSMVLTALAEVVKALAKVVEGLLKLTVGILKLCVGLVDLVKSPVVALMNAFRSKEDKIPYFALFNGMDAFAKTVFSDSKGPKAIYSEKTSERFLSSRDGLQGKLESVSAGKTTTNPTILPPSPTIARPAPIAPSTPPVVAPLTATTPTIAAHPTTPAPTVAAQTVTQAPIVRREGTRSDGALPAPQITDASGRRIEALDLAVSSGQRNVLAQTNTTRASTTSSNLTTEQLASAKVLAAASEQKRKAEEEMRNGPTSERASELKKLIEQSDRMIARVQTELQQAAPTSSPTFQTLFPSAGSMPIASTLLAATSTSPLSSSRSSTSTPTNYGDLSALQAAKDARDVAEKGGVPADSIPAFAAMSFEGETTKGTNVKPNVPPAEPAAVRRPPPVPGPKNSSHYGVPRGDDNSGFGRS